MLENEIQRYKKYQTFSFQSINYSFFSPHLYIQTFSLSTYTFKQLSIHQYIQTFLSSFFKWLLLFYKLFLSSPIHSNNSLPLQIQSNFCSLYSIIPTSFLHTNTIKKTLTFLIIKKKSQLSHLVSSNPQIR